MKIIKPIRMIKIMCFIFLVFLVFFVQTFSVLSVLFASSIFAGSIANTNGVSNVDSVGNTNDMINQAIARHNQILKENKSQVEEYKAITSQRIKKVQEIPNYQRLVNSIQKQSEDVNRSNTIKTTKKTSQAIVFVSFSMPLLSLQQIVQDASRYNIPVVMRGLYNNSFKDTAAKIFEVVKEKNRGGILIDPIWFKKFDIKSVPALVINKNDKFDVIYGNISLKQALGIIAEKSESGEISEIAKEILKEG